MSRKAINTRKAGVTKDMQASENTRVESFEFPGLGVTVEANSYAEALKKAKDITKKSKK